MGELWSTLGYDEVAVAIARALREQSGMALLEGPPGVGKSRLAEGIGALWEGSKGATVVAVGDRAWSDTDYYPFHVPLARLRLSSQRTGALGGAGRTVESLAGTGGVITGLVESLIGLRRGVRRGRAPFLSDDEHVLLHRLEQLSSHRPLLLMADNLHWWDRRSLDFLRRLQTEAMAAAFPFLRELRILAVQTTAPYQSVAQPEAHAELLAVTLTRRFSLGRIRADQFEGVLVALGVDAESAASVADVVFSLSGGHLALAHRAAARLVREGPDALLAAADADEFLNLLLTERVQSLGGLGAEAAGLLQVAAVLGLAFRRSEVMCATGVDEHEVGRVLRSCRDEQLLELSDDTCRFVHDLFRQFFLDAASQDVVAIHERLHTCLRSLRPADLELRCVNAVRAGRVTDAAELGVRTVLQRFRDGREHEPVPADVAAAIAERGYDTVLATFDTAQRALRRHRWIECRNALESLPRDLPKPLVAEADLLRAQSLMSTRSEADRAEGRSLLGVWVGYEQEEPELGLRLLRLLLYGLSHLVDKGPGRELEGRIKAALVDRVSFDVSAKDALYAMDRSAGSLYLPDITVQRTEEAARHFGPDGEGATVRRPAEYYRCLVNLAANQITNARYAEAQATSRRLDRLLDAYPPATFARVEFALMNGVLADLRTGTIDPAEAVVRQRAIVATDSAARDPYYPSNALAVYLAFDGRLDEAIAIWDEVERSATGGVVEPEPSMVYVISANRALAWYVAGDVDRALQAWDDLTPVVDRIAYTIRSILVRRHHLLGAVLGARRAMTPIEADECLIVDRPPEIGPVWTSLGRGFRLPEVEIWRDD